MRILVLTMLLAGLAGCGNDGGAHGDSFTSGAVDAPAGQPTEADVCAADERVTVTIVVEAPIERVYGLHTRLTYPASVALPGFHDEPAIQGRVTFLPPLLERDAGHPLRSVLRTINDQDGRVQTLMTSLDHFPDGPFVRIIFDCVAGRARPTADDFACEVAGATDLELQDLFGSTCHVDIAPPS